MPLRDESGGGAGGSRLDGSGGATGSGGAAMGSGGAAMGNGGSGAGGTTALPDGGPPDGRDAASDAPDVLGSSPPPPRLTAPLSTATVTSQRPTLRWGLAPGTDGAHIQICRDRACAVEMASFDAAGTSATPMKSLPAGVFFWRAYGRSAGVTGAAPSATWQLIVGNRSAPVDTSWGTTLDVNGDGYADVLVGAERANDDAGRAYLYLGGPAGLSTSPATTLDGPDGLGGYFGISVASAGDVNGDGYADVIISAPGISGGQGRAYLYLGGPGGLSTSPVTTLVGPTDMLGQFGISVAGAGDVNGDGYADVVIATYESVGGNGHAYLYLGGAAGLSAAPAATLTAPDGADSFFGASAAGAGDVNGDGYADVIVGDYGAGNLTGRAFLYLGGAGGLASSPSIILTGPSGVNGDFGVSVASAGDVNGDGYADVIIGAEGVAGLTGQAFVYLGRADGLAAAPVAILTGTKGVDSFFGASVASAGDVNGDGYADVIVGASGANNFAGRSYLYLGGAAGLASSPAATLSGPDGAGGDFGVSVAGAGDVDGDGYADVIIGAYLASNQAGQAYLYFGGAAALSSSLLTTITGAGGYFGVSVACTGDDLDGGARAAVEVRTRGPTARFVSPHPLG